MIRKLLCPGLVVLLTAGAFFIRVQGLGGIDGGLGTDEARLALAAQGVLSTGLPVVPSGRIYTRGLVSAYLMAPSLWFFGRHDFAARLPSAVVGALLIPVVFAFGRTVAGTPAGLCTAAFVVLHPSLIVWSRSAWMTSLFVLAFMTTAYLLHMGYGQDRPTLQLAAGLGFVITLFVHELAVLLPMAVLLTLATRAAQRDFRWFAGRKSVVALLTFCAGLMLLGALGLFLRMGTIAGPTAEFKTYLVPTLTLANLHYYYQSLAKDDALLLAVAAFGALLLIRSSKTEVRFLYVIVAVGIVTIGFLLGKYHERYGVMLLPLLAIIAAWSLVEGTSRVITWMKIPSAGAGLPTTVLVVVFGLSLMGKLRITPRSDPPFERTWLTEFQALRPAPHDLVFSDVPTIIAFYWGRVDYWARVEEYERFGYRSENEVRELYTGAVMVSSDEEFQRVVNTNPGRTLWYVGRLRRFYFYTVSPTLRARLLRTAHMSRITPDGWVILRITLGGQDAHRSRNMSDASMPVDRMANMRYPTGAPATWRAARNDAPVHAVAKRNRRADVTESGELGRWLSREG